MTTNSVLRLATFYWKYDVQVISPHYLLKAVIFWIITLSYTDLLVLKCLSRSVLRLYARA